MALGSAAVYQIQINHRAPPAVNVYEPRGSSIRTSFSSNPVGPSWILSYRNHYSSNFRISSNRTSNALLTQLPSEQNVLFPAPKRNQKQQFLLTGRERAGPTGSMLLEVYKRDKIDLGSIVTDFSILSSRRAEKAAMKYPTHFGTH